MEDSSSWKCLQPLRREREREGLGQEGVRVGMIFLLKEFMCICIGKELQKSNQESLSLGQAEVLWNKIPVTVVREKGKWMAKGVKKVGKLKKGGLNYQFARRRNGRDGVQRNSWRWEEGSGWGGDGVVWDGTNKIGGANLLHQADGQIREERGISEKNHPVYYQMRNCQIKNEKFGRNCYKRHFYF